MNESDLIPYKPSYEIPASHVLVLAPHPDDEIFGCAGAIAAHLQHGASVHVVVLTEGSLQGIGDVRAHECLAAAAILGYGQPIFWSEPDRSLAASDRLINRLADFLNSKQIDLLYAPSPWEIHPDHRQAYWLAVEAVRRVDGFCRIAFYEVGSALRPNLLLDITPYLELKQQAMACFRSQMVFQPYDEQVYALNRFRTYTLPKTVKAAEAFLLLSREELESFSALQRGEMVSWSVSPSAGGTATRQALVSVLVRSVGRNDLFATLDSVALQTWPYLEVIVVAEVPGHNDLPLRCGAHSLRLLKSETPISRSAAANLALREANGEFLIFIDDDGWMMPGHITRLVRALQLQPQILAAHTDVALVGTNGSPLGQTLDFPFELTCQQARHVTPVHAMMFKASVLSKGLIFDESLNTNEVWDFWLRLAHLSVVCHVPGVSAVYRMDDKELMAQERFRNQPNKTLLLEYESAGLISQSDQHYSSKKDSGSLDTKMNKYIESLHTHIAVQDAVLQSIIASRSWRLTRPLRAIAALLRP
jgi:LmbE family N-acetylglucosaminyl deacetylase